MNSDWEMTRETVVEGDIETQPELAQFLDHLLAESLAHPEHLTDASEVFAADEDLVSGAGNTRVQETTDLLARSTRLAEGVPLEEETATSMTD
jgi:hypothetical protein